MAFNLFRRKPKIVFLFAPRYKSSGSTVMRGEQLSSIVKKYHNKTYDIRYQELTSAISNSVIFLTKGAITDSTEDQLIILKARGNKILIDPVDSPLDERKAKLSSGVVAASLEAQDAYAKLGFPTYLVNHHVDPRIPRDILSKVSELKCGYFGELVNTIITDKIATYVDFIHVDTGKQADDWLIKPPLYNLHYAIRSNNVEGFKPFLKGFTAAMCGANILIQEDQKEAIRWLGKDYPYLVKANPKEKDIVNMLEHIKASYDGNEWKKAQRQMEKIRQAISDEAIAEQLVNAVNAVSR